MSFETSPAWKVSYGNEQLDSAFKRLLHTERIDSLWGTASHTFGVSGSDGGEPWSDTLLRTLLSKLGKELTFNVEDLAGIKLERHTHIVVNVEHAASVDVQSPPYYIVKTMEKRILMSVNNAMEVHDGEISSMVSKMINRTGLRVDKIEETKVPKAFKTLHQPGWSDHTFVVEHLIKRATSKSGKSGYQIYSNKGDRVCFSTLDYRSRRMNIDRGQLRRVVDFYDPLTAMYLDGGSNEVFGFNRKSLEVIKGKSEFSGKLKSSSTFVSPHNEEEELTVSAKVLTDRSKWHESSFTVHLFGGKELGDVDFPFSLSLKGTKFKEDDNITGHAISRIHEVSGGVYSIAVVCVK